MPSESNTLTLRDYLVPIVKRRWMIVALVVTITAIVSAYYATRPLTYTASTKVYIGPQSDPALGVGPTEPSPELVADQAALLTSTETATQVAKAIGYTGSPAALAGSVVATPSDTTNFLSITAQAPSSAEAAQWANAFARQFIAQNASSQVGADSKEIAALTKQLKALHGPTTVAERQSLQQQIQQLQITSSTAVGSATQVDSASGGVAARHSVVEFGVLAAIGALVGGILIAFLLERMDPRLKGIQQTEMIFQHPVLATVWHDEGIKYFVDGKPALSPRSREAFRDLRIGLSLAGGEDVKTIVISSAVPDEGKSTAARNLALALAESGQRVVLVDADLRKPALHRGLGLEPRSGLAEVIVGNQIWADVIAEVPIGLPSSKAKPKPATERPEQSSNGFAQHSEAAAAVFDEFRAAATPVARPIGFAGQRVLFFIGAGKKAPNPQGLLESESFRALLDDLKSAFDTVVIDSTPLTLVSDAIPVVRNVDGVLLVVRSSTDSRSARHAAEILKRVPDVNIVGLVVNDVPEAAAAAYGKGYGYGYYGYGYGNRYGDYGYGYLAGDDEAATPEPPPLRLG
jgi:succinoglycan biosynthesis transport protein ExoP